MQPDELQHEWEAVKSAPYLSAATALIVILVVWAVVHFLYQRFIRSLKRDLESEQLESARLRGRIAEYEAKAGSTPDEAHARIEALEQRLIRSAPRRLSDQQKATLTAALAATPGVARLQTAIGTQDGLLFQRDFAEVFQRAGWKIESGQTMGGMETEHGLLVLYYRETPQLRALFAGLSSVGLKYEVWDLSNQETEVQTGLLICPRALG